MKILAVEELAIPEIKLVRFARFRDARGYFTETFRRSQIAAELPFLRGLDFVQTNESFSKAGVVRGLHFQWNPFMGKLVRTVHGRMVDLFLDIRRGSPTFGAAAAHAIVARPETDAGEWIWIPPGFAHGNFFTEDTTIEYCCSGEHSPGCEAGIAPFAPDIDWSRCEPELKKELDAILRHRDLMTEKDRKGFTMEAWAADERSAYFRYEELR